MRKPNDKRKTYEDPDAAIQWAVRKHRCSPTCFWDYQELHDDQRFDLMRVYRFDPPGDRKQYYPVHTTHEGWQVGDPPGKLPLYGLPELSKSETVIITEGEKCADLVRSMGLVATTSSHGALSAAKTDWRPLTGKSVVIVPDNDDEGEGYALSVAKLLVELKPTPNIRILRLPNLEKKGDIQQWMDEVIKPTWGLGDLGIELGKLTKGAPLWEPPPGSGPLLKIGEWDDGPLMLTELGNARRLIRAKKDSIRYNYVAQRMDELGRPSMGCG